MSTRINHLLDAEARLLEQYRDHPGILGLLTALVGPYQTLEDAFQALAAGRGVVGAVGVQLDRLGDLVGIRRGSMPDEVYRTRIRIKIIQNISQGEPERLIEVYGMLLGATLVQIQEHFPGGVALSANGVIPDGQDTLIYQNVQSVAPAGVRVDYIATYPAGAAFTFAGGPEVSGGFGDQNNPQIGGGFGTQRPPLDVRFVFAGGVPGNDGFGDLRDPIAGGHLKSA